jgi:chemotaxis protein MotB
MARKEKQEFEEEAPPGVPGWMLTFCDCMTLLLTFFVLLLSFSSFDEASLRQLKGSMKFRARPAPSVSNNPNKIDDSVSAQVMPIIDRTDKGAEKRDPAEGEKLNKNPKKVIIPVAKDAYHDETVLSIPLETLFMGDHSVLMTAVGKDRLAIVASYLKLKPHYVMIGGASPQRASSRSTGGVDMGLLRSWKVLQYFEQQQNLPPDRFCISGKLPRPLQLTSDKPTMQIVLLSKDVTRLPDDS